MKIPLIIVAASVGTIEILTSQKSEKVVYSDKFQHEIFEAPEDLNEYPPKDGINHGSGLYSKIISPATNDRPLSGSDIVHLDYKVWNKSGKNIDASNRKYHRIKFRVDGGGRLAKNLIPGWSKIIPYLKEGETRLVWMPPNLAYGDKGAPEVLGRLLFEMRIAKVERAIAKPEFDEYPEQPTTESKKSASGLTSLKINDVEGSASPKDTDRVVVHMDIWNSEGELFSSTRAMNRVKQLSIPNVVSGVKEALSMMKVGERFRFWIPKELGYKNISPKGFPKGDWICDIELIEISEPSEDFTSHHMEKLKSGSTEE